MKLMPTAPWLATIALATAASFRAGIESGQDPEQRDAPSLQQEARKVLRAIGVLLACEADPEKRFPIAEAPFDSSSFSFARHGFGEGAESQMHRIGVRAEPGAKRSQLVWSFDEGSPSSHAIVLAEGVAPFLEGELPNGKDDNGNGLIDERGLSFTMDRDALTVRLTLERDGPDGVEQTTVQSTMGLRRTAKTSGF